MNHNVTDTFVCDGCHTYCTQEVKSNSSCKHISVCVECYDSKDAPHGMYNGECLYCILDGDAIKLDNIHSHKSQGSSFHECCDVVMKFIKLGQYDNLEYVWSDDPINYIGSYDYSEARENIAFCRNLYSIGFKISA